MTAARLTVAGCLSNGNCSARSGEYRLAMTSRNACAYGRAAVTRSCVRFSFDVATISSVRVIFRVFSTDLMRPLSSRPLAMSDGRKACGVRCHELQIRFADAGGFGRRDGLLVRLDASTQVRLDLLRER